MNTKPFQSGFRTLWGREFRLFFAQLALIPSVMLIFHVFESRYVAGTLASSLFLLIGLGTLRIEQTASRRSRWVKSAALLHLLAGFLPVFIMAQFRRVGLLPEPMAAWVGPLHGASSLIYLHLLAATLVWAVRTNYPSRA